MTIRNYVATYVHFMILAIFAYFLTGLASFFIKTMQITNLGEDSIIMH